MTNIVSSNMTATDKINMDAGIGLNVIGLPDKIGANENISIGVSKDGEQYEFGIGGGVGVDVSSPNKSNITAVNGITGKAEYILDVNSNMDTSGFRSHILANKTNYDRNKYIKEWYKW